MDFYYQIKGRKSPDFHWEWPPVLSGKVTAKDKKSARALLESEHSQDFPLRVAEKNKETAYFLLSLREIAPGDKRTLDLFVPKNCLECSSEFKIIDKYNDENNNDKGGDCCSTACRIAYREKLNKTINASVSVGKSTGSCLIYRIYNKITEKNYIGQTTQSFTLRWYQHFFQGSGTPFHLAIQNSKVTDWEFSVLEVVKIEMRDVDKALSLFSDRESHWINVFDSIKNGYNTMTVNKTKNSK